MEGARDFSQDQLMAEDQSLTIKQKINCGYLPVLNTH